MIICYLTNIDLYKTLQPTKNKKKLIIHFLNAIALDIKYFISLHSNFLT